MSAQDDGPRTRRRKPAAQPGTSITPPEEAPRRRQGKPRLKDIAVATPAAPAGEPAAPRTERRVRRRAVPQPEVPAGAVPAEQLVSPTLESSVVSDAAEAALLEDVIAPAAAAESALDVEAVTPAKTVGPDAAAEAQSETSAERRRRERGVQSNALGMLFERHFADPTSPCRSYSDLERHSGISREALSRYVTARPDRRRSPTIDTLVATADAMHLSLEAVCRAAAASVKGVIPPPEQEQQAREEVLGTLAAALTGDQFSAVVELLRQIRPMRNGG